MKQKILVFLRDKKKKEVLPIYKPEKPEKLSQRSEKKILLNLNIPAFRFLVDYSNTVWKNSANQKDQPVSNGWFLIREIFISTRILIIYSDEQQIILETTPPPPPRSSSSSSSLLGDQSLVIIVNFLKRARLISSSFFEPRRPSRETILINFAIA